jgi:hypothetical protein
MMMADGEKKDFEWNYHCIALGDAKWHYIQVHFLYAFIVRVYQEIQE